MVIPEFMSAGALGRLSREIRVPWINTSAEPTWLWTQQFPNPKLQSLYSNMWLNMTVFVATTLFGSKTKIKFIPVTNWQMADLNDSDSVDGSLYYNLTDMSPPRLWATDYRLQTLKLPFIGPMRAVNLMVAYNPENFNTQPTLAFRDIYPSFVYIPIVTITSVLWFYKLLNRSLLQLDWVKIRERLRTRTLGRILTLFFLGIFLGVLRSNIVLLLNIPLPPHKPFRSREDVVRGLSSGYIQALSEPSNMVVQHFLSPFDFCHISSVYERLCTASRANPPQLGSILEISDRLRMSTDRWVIALDSDWEGSLSTMNCKLHFFVDEETRLALTGVFIRPGWRPQMRVLTPQVNRIISREFEHLKLHYDNIACRYNRTGTTSDWRPTHVITFGQAWGFFWTQAMLVGLTILFFSGELACFRLRSRLSSFMNVSVSDVGLKHFTGPTSIAPQPEPTNGRLDTA